MKALLSVPNAVIKNKKQKQAKPDNNNQTGTLSSSTLQIVFARMKEMVTSWYSLSHIKRK